MKYMLTGASRTPALMRLTLSCTLVFLGCLWISNGLLYFSHMNLDPHSVLRYYLGSEEEFASPRTYASMLEATHMHLAMMALVLLLLTHLAIFIPWPVRLLVALVLGTFASGLLEEGAGWLVRFVHPGFAWLKVLSFVALQANLLVLLAGLAWHLNRRPPSPRLPETDESFE